MLLFTFPLFNDTRIHAPSHAHAQALAEKKEQLRREIQQMKNLIEKGLDYKQRSFGDLHVTVMEARDLPQKSKFDKNDPYCIVWLQGTEYKFQVHTCAHAHAHTYTHTHTFVTQLTLRMNTDQNCIRCGPACCLQ